MFKEYEMQKHFEREQKLKQMTEEEREQFLLEEKQFETEREVKHKLDPVCINMCFLGNIICYTWFLFECIRFITQEVKSNLKKCGKNKMKWKEKILILEHSL